VKQGEEREYEEQLRDPTYSLAKKTLGSTRTGRAMRCGCQRGAKRG
jgi:hypothetical protein